ncbi:MAG: bifunctional 5,10-methylene-tetrahydrofolate dehydrogenase/5,10-methylene-tetrahydrofolate cyclohydrolase [Lentisphaerae bacterium]|nr:bifunctional 5,10-methylene-tetrahydrofolate dehydrogenase/5,10-methylene-tetrahydrofolate cyclohydrolase [Lentisphaerota bacterium]
METKILSGKECAASVNAETMQMAADFKSKYGIAPALAVILIGEDPASCVYVNSKAQKCIELGLRSEKFLLDKDATMEEVLELIARLNADETIHGILVQSPPPPQIDEEKVIAAIDPAKDVDCFHALNVGKMLIGKTDGFFPCTPYGVLKILEYYNIDPAGKHVVVIGRSNIVGKPLMALMVQKAKGANATVTCVHSGTADLATYTSQADILIAAIGKSEFVKADMVKDGAVVIDVGINRIPDASKKSGFRLVGDVDYANVAPKCTAITPVPGGVGPMTIAMLMRNTVRAALMSRGEKL